MTSIRIMCAAFPTRLILASLILASLFLASTSQAQTPIPVQIRPLSEVLVDLERNAPADVRSLNATTLSAEVNALVEQVFTDVGHTVKQGETLLELDASDYRLALNQAEANLASSNAQKTQADARLKRARELGANQYVSADDLLLRETEVVVIAAQIQVQEAHVAIARRNLQKCQIVAPFDGVVVARQAQLGAYVTPGSPLLGLTQTDRIELDAEIPDELAESLQKAHAFRFVSRNESWVIRLLRLSPVVNAERRSRQARFEFIDETPAVGRNGEVVWQVEKGLLPANLVVRRKGLLGIFLNRSGTATFTPLPGAQEGRPVVVDLPGDSEIIVQGRERLQDGDTIVTSAQSS